MWLTVLMLLAGAAYSADTPVPTYSVTEAIALKKQDSRAIYVDTRNEKEFLAAHIPSSINIPLHFVKAKMYLKGMKTILINQGYNLEQLRREGKVMQQRGFDVAVLAGGIAAWQQQGQPLENEDFGEQDFSLIPAVDLLHRNSSSFFSLLVDISLADQQEEEKQSVFPGTVIRHPVRGKEDASKLLDVIRNHDLDERDSILILEENGDYSQLKYLAQQCRPTVFFLQGGLKEYQRQLERQRAMLQPREKRLKKVGGCSSCPSGSGQNRGKEEL
jgi:rhodanese-related sulfurtransferase